MEIEDIVSFVIGIFSLAFSVYIIYLAWNYIPEFLGWVLDSLNINMSEIAKKLLLGLVGACGTVVGTLIALKIKVSIEVRGLIFRLLTLSHAIAEIKRCLSRTDGVSVGGVGGVLFGEKEVIKITKYIESKEAYEIIKVVSAMRYISDPNTQISEFEYKDIISNINNPDIAKVVKDLRQRVLFSKDMDESMAKLTN